MPARSGELYGYAVLDNLSKLYGRLDRLYLLLLDARGDSRCESFFAVFADYLRKLAVRIIVDDVFGACPTMSPFSSSGAFFIYEKPLRRCLSDRMKCLGREVCRRNPTDWVSALERFE